MKKIFEYFVILADITDDFDERMQAALNEGFQPYGNPFFENCNIYQAMVKYEDENICKGCGASYLIKPCCAMVKYENEKCLNHGQTQYCECFVRAKK